MNSANLVVGSKHRTWLHLSGVGTLVGIVVNAVLVVSWFAFAWPCFAQQHRAVRLGNPSTRFAPPLKKPEDLRSLFRDPKLRPDIESILQQVKWQGNVNDLYHAAATAPIREFKIPVGTRMPFMSARKNGQPVVLLDVLWAGDEPVDAYVFEFSSNGRRYRCVTPKPCSNFYMEDLGPEQPTLTLAKAMPAAVSLCAPFEMEITVRNTSTKPLTGVRVTDVLPAGLATTTGKTNLELDAGTLKPGEGMLFKVQLVAKSAGRFENVVRALTAEGATGEASATTTVRAPELDITCSAPKQVQVKRPLDVCATVKNTGSEADPRVTVLLPLPERVTVLGASEGGRVATDHLVWELLDFAPQSSRVLCASLVANEPARLVFRPKAEGICAFPVETHCEAEFIGVAGVLFEVVDLEDPVVVGENVTYEIKVLNQGSAPLTRVRLSCAIPEQQEFVSAEGPTHAHVIGRSVTMDPVPSLDGKASVTWRVVVKAIAPGDVRLKASLVSDEFTTPIEEIEATQQY